MESPLSSRVAHSTNTGLLMDKIDQFGSIDLHNSLIPLTWTSPRLDTGHADGGQDVESYSSARDTLRAESPLHTGDLQSLCTPSDHFATPLAVKPKVSIPDNNRLAFLSPVMDNYDFGTISPRSGRFIPLSPISYNACVKFKTWKYPLLATSGLSDAHDDLFGGDKQDDILLPRSSNQSTSRRSRSRNSSVALDVTEPSQSPRFQCTVHGETGRQAKDSKDFTMSRTSSL